MEEAGTEAGTQACTQACAEAGTEAGEMRRRGRQVRRQGTDAVAGAGRGARGQVSAFAFTPTRCFFSNERLQRKSAWVTAGGSAK